MVLIPFGELASGEKLPNRASRTTALTSVDRSFLVEAGAGSGKTSIMAGRVAVLFARGVEPKNVAAITASELRIRIERFVNELSAGTIPPDLDSAFPNDVPALQRENLARARKALDELVCSTIHGFAQALIKAVRFARRQLDIGDDHVDGVAIENVNGGHGTQRHNGAHPHTFEGTRCRICERDIIIHE